MKTKYLISLLAIILTTTIASAQQPTRPEPPEPPDDLVDNASAFSLLVDRAGFLGVHAEDINRENITRYNLNQPRGVGITQIVKDSPAEKAGLRKDDVILRIDGENVTSVRKLNRIVSEMAPDHSVRIAISRAGAEQELTATIGKRASRFSLAQGFPMDNNQGWQWEGLLDRYGKQNGPGEFSFHFGNSRRIGVSTMELTKQLADYFGITGGKGVLVTTVFEDSPAAKAGLKAGDVITAIDGETVDSQGDISRIIGSKKEGEVTLTIIRNKAQQTIRVLPSQAKTSINGLPQIGRRIVIPRIEIPTIPDVDLVMPEIQVPNVDIVMPRISIPSIPAINIQMPRVRVTPRVRVLRPVTGPI
jgi:predicted metalloprotease with PDZ domain